MSPLTRRPRKLQRKVSPYLFFALLSTAVLLLYGHLILNMDQSNSIDRMQNAGYQGMEVHARGNNIYQENFTRGTEESVDQKRSGLGKDKNRGNFILNKKENDYQENVITDTKQNKLQKHFSSSSEQTGPQKYSVRDTEKEPQAISYRDKEDRGHIAHPAITKQEGEAVQPSHGILDNFKDERITSPQQNYLNVTRTSTHQPLHRPQSLGALFCTVPEVLPGWLEARRKKALTACARLHQRLSERRRKELHHGPSSALLSKLRWDTSYHLLYCPIPKVASSTWAWHLLRVAGVEDKEITSTNSLQALLQRYLPPPSPLYHEIGFLKTALKFIVTRHPYQRLVSAYKAFIKAGWQGQSEYSGGWSINHNPEVATFLSFSIFCSHVINTTEQWLHDHKKHPPHPFVMPMTFICSPCGFQYDVYSKLDTMDMDAVFIAAQCGLSHIINSTLRLSPDSTHKLHPSPAQNRIGTKDDISVKGLGTVVGRDILEDSANSILVQEEYAITPPIW
ncbi:hypothetical protein Pmani_023857 [Petrolisthes manimaculis]|uniref:Carbohydrate sulfotransferase n=1 Tax=Petrolisthes manimaculis TaxID=1843537 RepID=A0AAE1P924_9EUCA|nr:hypothetical protein Pmani_023857 [Petrolisthes manimaculis]